MLEQSQNTLFEVQESVSQTSSRRASRANPSQLQVAVKELVTSVIYGPKSQESFAKLGQDGSWEKTSEGSLALMMEECSEPFSGTWPSWGIASGGHATEQTKPQELHNAGTESLLSDTWRTPSAGDPEGGVMEMREGASGKYKLRDHAANWPTPKAWDGRREGVSPSELLRESPDLKTVDHCWPTPVANDDNKTFEAHMAMKARMKGGPRMVATSLQVVVQVWPSSPQAQENSTDGQESSQSDQTSPPRSRPTKRLNYRFSLWLMGFPEDWL